MKLFAKVADEPMLGSTLCRFTEAPAGSPNEPDACRGGGGGGGAAVTALKMDAACICDQAQFMVHVFLVLVQYEQDSWPFSEADPKDTAVSYPLRSYQKATHLHLITYRAFRCYSYWDMLKSQNREGAAHRKLALTFGIDRRRNDYASWYHAIWSFRN